MPLPEPAYSYRDDPSVPDFDDTHPVAFMDGDCVLCMAGARVLDWLDQSGTIRICPIQTTLGRAVLRHYGLSPDDSDTWVVLHAGKAYSSVEAMIRIGSLTGGAGRAVLMLRLLPRPVQDWLYRRLARNRYWMFGRRDSCTLPTPSLRARILG